jgi:hypothetical protein
MALKVYTCAEAASGPKTFLNIFANFSNKMNLPQPDSGPDSNINTVVQFPVKYFFYTICFSIYLQRCCFRRFYMETHGSSSRE